MGASSNYPLRLPQSLKTAAEKTAQADGTSLNQFIVTAVAEKLSAMRTSDYLAERIARADFAAFDRFMARPNGAPPRPDDVID
ncbi:YlcI/YnfO family protein [Inquilinus sp. CAU 1745]|uniref:YlcI/YnfO family protein n=1 Tax=Inquilinus sp. CAU 1745 TaxID=3140369 RepID=UPI00325B1741